MSKPSNFNIRVYGLLIHEGKVLVSDEVRSGNKMTKFPGGGLEFGEGLADCLIREFEEELGIEIAVGEFFYTNEFLQISAFRKEDQLQSIYYIVSAKDVEGIKVVKQPFERLNEDNQCFRWLKLSGISELDFTYPIDKIVAKKLLND